MASYVVNSAIDIALWFFDRATREGNNIQAQMLQRLTYISFGIYGARYHGRRLMPSVFVANELGPIDPNVYRVFEEGRPKLSKPSLPTEVEDFLEGIWAQFNHMSTDNLTKLVTQQAPYKTAIGKGNLESIDGSDIISGFLSPREPQETFRSADGRLVQKWNPKNAKPS